MIQHSLTHLSDGVLLRDLKTMLAREREATATLLAHIAEVDARRLYAAAGYSSMFTYCVGELRLSEDSAAKRIHAARAARQFPALFTALAEGSIHLSGVSLLAPHLTPENVEGLIEAATHRRKSEIEELVIQRFQTGTRAPRSMIRALPPAPLSLAQHAPGHVEEVGMFSDPEPSHAAGNADFVRGRLEEHAPGHVEERFLVQITIDKSTRERLLYAQALLSHAVPDGDLTRVFQRALEALITQVEKRKLGSCSRARTPAVTSKTRHVNVRRGPAARPRHVPIQIRRAVWERDLGQCTFVSVDGHRCRERRFLEFDHVQPVARGGTATIEGLRLRCRAHNQYEAERAFGADFMRWKRASVRRTIHPSVERPRAGRHETDELTQDVVAGLRSLGCRSDEARRAALFSANLGGGTLEERMRAALGFISRRSCRALPVAMT